MYPVDLSPFEMQLQERVPNGLGGRWYGVCAALVTDIKDPDRQGRVKIALPWSPDTGGQRFEAWARLATLFGGNNRGSWFVPDVDDEVLVCFEQGDPRRPFVLGGEFEVDNLNVMACGRAMELFGRLFTQIESAPDGTQVTVDW